MEAKILGYSQDDLKNLSIDILNHSKKYGAEQAELDISLSSGKTISVRNQETETIESNNDKNLKNGYGVIMDDIVAGIYTIFTLMILNVFI